MNKSVTQLTSRNNLLLKKIRRLASGTHSEQDEIVMAEGTRVLEEVLQSDCFVESVVVSENFGSDPRESRLLESWLNRKIRLYQITEKLFQSLSCFHTAQGAIALVRVPAVQLQHNKAPDALVLYASGIQDPGNLGTLIRSAAASGSTLLCTSPGTCSARNPKAIRSSAGVFFHHTPVERIPQETFIRFCKEHSICIYRTDTLHGVPYTESDLASPSAILLGNEGNGIHEEAFLEFPAICIPMSNRVDSLNVALAGAVLLFEAARQRSLKKHNGQGF